jgi:hypothetical protein
MAVSFIGWGNLELVYRMKLSFTQVKEHTIDFVKLPVQSVPVTTKFVSSNPIHVKVYSIQHYVIKFVSDLQQVGGFVYICSLAYKWRKKTPTKMQNLK